ncbi:metabolite/drug transporter, putative [Plasmodium sp. DRC-Itaito]|nr:metabolite/drug transporter, putative [Plasmodium sp. DRC-Itaito]
MEKVDTANNDGEKCMNNIFIIKRIFFDLKNLFPKSKVQYTYVNVLLLSLFFTFIHKYLDQTLPSLYKSIENDFNVDVKSLYYMNTLYKLAYSAANFFFALFFDYTFKRIVCAKYYDKGKEEDISTNNATNYEVSVKNDSDYKETTKLIDDMSIQTNYKEEDISCINISKEEEKEEEEEIVFHSVDDSDDLFKKSEDVTISEYGYILNILIISSIIYIIVILGIMISNSLFNFFFFMFVMGINNSCIYILIQKIYTNNVFSENRSTIFGFLHFFSSVSHMLSISINTNLSNKLYYGFTGWRICYFIISFFPVFVSIFIFKLIRNHKLKRSKTKENFMMNYVLSFDKLTDVFNEPKKKKKKLHKLEELVEPYPSLYYKKDKMDKTYSNKKKEQEDHIFMEDNEYNKKKISPSAIVNTFEDNFNLTEEKSPKKKNEYRNLENNEMSEIINNATKINDDKNMNSKNINNFKMDSNNITRRSYSRSYIKENQLKLQNNYNNESEENYVNNIYETSNVLLKSSSIPYENYKKKLYENKNPFSIFKNNNTYEKNDKNDNKGEMDELLGNEKQNTSKYEFSYLYEIKYVFKNYSFWLMITMGMLNGIPKHVLSLMIYFFQYCNISDFKSGFIISVSWLCASLISPFIGIISDYIYKLNKDINRQRIGMYTHCFRIFLMFTLFYFIPKEATSFIYFVIISLFMGILSGWINIGTHKPIIIDIVKQRHTAFIMALMNAFENIGSSIIGTFLLSHLLNKYDYIDKKKIHTVVNINVNKHNVNVLSDVLLILTCFPWLLSFCLLYALKYTYKKDKLYNNII